MTILVAVIIFGNTSQQERCAEHTALRPKGPCCAAQQIRPLNVRYGSITSFSTPSDHVGSYPNNDQPGDPLSRSKRAMNRLTHCNKFGEI
jgi:hypothetical protein